jgi:hypothetical protein
MTPDRTRKSLKAAAAFCIAIGLAMAAAPFTALAPGLDLFLDIAHLPIDGGQQISTDTEALLSAISGGLLAGLGTAVWLIAHHLHPRDPALAARIVTLTLAAWYIPDSAGSLAAGAWFNVVMNTGFLALFLVPLGLSERTAKAPA